MEEYKNFEDHLEGLLILNNKIGGQMELRYTKDLNDPQQAPAIKLEEEEVNSHVYLFE